MQVRCPHCNNPVEVLDDSSLTDITCPSCDSRFNLLADETLTYREEEHPTIGHFELQSKLGTGAFGTVWKAKDTELDRSVAVKIPRKEQLDATESEQFIREARAAAQLMHPNIVSVHEVGREQGQVYIVSDLIDGLSLSDWLSGQQLASREAAELCAKVADALEHAHQAGVIHRDLKPSNIMIDASGEPHIMDFGLAKREAGEITMTTDGQVLGTPAYMSPEQAKGESHDADARSDVYSLGVVLFELLTNEKPFRGSMRMLMHQVIHEEPPSPRKLNAAIPRDLETICLKCLQKESRQRYQTAGKLGDDLRRFINGDAVLARPISRAARFWRWCKRNRTVAALTASVAASLSIGIALTSYFAIESNNERESALRLATEKEDLAVEESDARELAEQRLTRAEWLLYASQIARAQLEWKDGNIAVAREILDACRSDYRGWEHGYLSKSFDSEMTFQGHESSVSSVAFSPDGRRIVSGSSDDTLKLWDTETGQERLTFKGHTLFVTSVAFSPDGRRIVSGAEDKSLKVWDAENGAELFTLTGHKHYINSVAFSPDGRRIVSGSWDGTLKVWDAASGQETLTLEGGTGRVYSVAFSPDGRRIVSGGSDGTVKVWDSESGQERLTLKGHTDPIKSVAFSPDGKKIISGSWDDTLKLWDTETGQEKLTFKGHTGSVTSVAFSPDGRRIVSGAEDRSLKVWDAETGAELLTLRGHTGVVESVASSPDGLRIVSGSSDKTVKVWNALSHLPLKLKGHTGPVNGVAFSPDGRRIVSGSSDGTLKAWDAASGQESLTLKGHTGGVTSVAFSPDGQQIVSGSGGPDDSGEVRLWDAENGQEKLTLKTLWTVRSVAFSPDGLRIAGGKGFGFDGSLGEILVWDIATGHESPEFSYLNQPGNFNSVVFSPDGKQIVSGDGGYGDAGYVQVWDAQTGQEMITLNGHTDGVKSVAVSPDGRRIVSGGYDRTLKVWDAKSGREVFTLNGHSDDVFSVAFSPDGRQIVSGGRSELHVWDAASGQETLMLRGGYAGPAAFSPDGRRIVCASGETLRVLDARVGQEGLTGNNSQSEE